PAGKLRAMPPLMLRALGLLNPTLRELVEMQYQFDEPFIVDSSTITDELGIRATSLDQALADTLQSYHHGCRRPRRAKGDDRSAVHGCERPRGRRRSRTRAAAHDPVDTRPGREERRPATPRRGAHNQRGSSAGTPAVAGTGSRRAERSS
ncbi:MAG TPA: hypothetical protein VHH34_15910, partial [Pseudonocardiaceae bacterium]|nr:hypothetical protein [Pseudonocardiaceae bacterium]